VSSLQLAATRGRKLSIQFANERQKALKNLIKVVFGFACTDNEVEIVQLKIKTNRVGQREEVAYRLLF
jgi:hypothetical protein